jgi:hypothetical protein
MAEAEHDIHHNHMIHFENIMLLAKQPHSPFEATENNLCQNFNKLSPTTIPHLSI